MRVLVVGSLPPPEGDRARALRDRGRPAARPTATRSRSSPRPRADRAPLPGPGRDCRVPPARDDGRRLRLGRRPAGARPAGAGASRAAGTSAVAARVLVRAAPRPATQSSGSSASTTSRAASAAGRPCRPGAMRGGSSSADELERAGFVSQWVATDRRSRRELRSAREVDPATTAGGAREQKPRPRTCSSSCA